MNGKFGPYIKKGQKMSLPKSKDPAKLKKNVEIIKNYKPKTFKKKLKG